MMFSPAIKRETSASVRIPASCLKKDSLHCNAVNAGTISEKRGPNALIRGIALPSLPVLGAARRPVAKIIFFPENLPLSVSNRKPFFFSEILRSSHSVTTETWRNVNSIRSTSNTDAACSLAG